MQITRIDDNGRVQFALNFATKMFADAVKSHPIAFMANPPTGNTLIFGNNGEKTIKEVFSEMYSLGIELYDEIQLIESANLTFDDDEE